MTRRWFLGTIGAALIGARGDESKDTKLVEAFAGNVQVCDSGELLIDLETLQSMIRRTPLASLGVNLDGLRLWDVVYDPGVMSVTATLPFGGQVSFIEQSAGRTLATVAANNIPGARGLRLQGTMTGRLGSASAGDEHMFAWRIGKLPIPDVMVDYIPAVHALGSWVRKHNRLAQTQAIARGLGAGPILPPGLV